ncbi:hypothetical protein DICPUDRAFT_89500 [Dictyostelium purpureum]|uniref:Sulfotransferase domain-containing protein n=1 Tax=Dictyostelium purpureum TaxID=5786 RepID=F0ZW93_DICPU|nr:uncharacterized protein DICPUDRAFT_89500 [Dictyostelium purpureum]EGC31795.1 hypothetical protein DICPUDRAFT_89500 [Dictyostelium purpureum]|eukprot:XP_003291690.1 hypothetical protein DICPUDRAFT_89500 [Dictyostelium purpureum]
MFNRKVTLYNKPNNGKKNNTSKIFLMVIVIAILVIVFVQSASISSYSGSINTDSVSKAIEQQIVEKQQQHEKKVDNQQQIIDQQVEKQQQAEKQQQQQQHLKKEEDQVKPEQTVRVPPSYKQKEKPRIDIEIDILTKKEREHLQRVVIQEWKDEVEILKNLDIDPGYASIPKIPEDYTPPTGEELERKIKDQTWKLKKEENPFLLPKPHIFIHVPKTAGSSLAGIFRRNEKRDSFAHHWMHPNYRELENVVKKDTVFGHIRYGLHNYYERVYPDRLPANEYGLNKYSYITMLREPVDRVISNYYYHRQNRKDPFHDLAMKYELRDWIKVSAAANNEQARMICGLGWSDFGNETISQIAHHHLKYTFKHVGITEDFVGSLVLLSHYSGLQNIRFSKINTGRQRVSVDTIPDDVIEEIKERNWIDISLYEMAKDIYNKQIDLIGREFFEKEVQEYKGKFMNKYSLPSNGIRS